MNFRMSGFNKGEFACNLEWKAIKCQMHTPDLIEALFILTMKNSHRGSFRAWFFSRADRGNLSSPK